MNKLLLLGLVCLLVSCGLPSYTREKIDIARFNATQVNGIAHITMKHEIMAEQSQAPDGGYIDREDYISPDQGNYGGYREFYSTGELKRVGPSFCGFFWGKHKFYDKNGKAIQEINFDTPYKFSLFSLQHKIKREFKIDIRNRNVAVSRTSESNPPTYTVIFETTGGKRTITFDGNTGKVTADIILPVKY